MENYGSKWPVAYQEAENTLKELKIPAPNYFTWKPLLIRTNCENNVLFNKTVFNVI